jgi:hypothetical protein
MVVLLLVPPVMPASAATPRGSSPVGSWEGYLCVTAGQGGGRYPNSTTISSYDPVTGAFSGTDDASDLGPGKITGTLSSDGAVADTITHAGVALHGQGVMTFYADGSAAWTGTWTDTLGQSGCSFSTLENDVAGTVEGVECGETSCRQSGLGGITILVTGTDRDGDPVSVTDVTADDGSWSVDVPAGSYTVGPTENGKAVVDIPSFDPGPTKIAVPPAANVDFRTCVVQEGEASSTSGASAELVRGSAIENTAATSAAGPATPGLSDCTSLYTVTLSASVPQHELVEPSLLAHYNTSSNLSLSGYNTSSSSYWITNLLRRNSVTRQLVTVPKFPECMTDKQVADYTAEGAKVEWYTWIKGAQRPNGAPVLLGKDSVTFAWDQSTGQVSVVGEKSLQQGELERVFMFRLSVGGKSHTAFCAEWPQVKMLMSPVDSRAAGASGLVKKNQFTIIATWEFPFDPLGVKIDAEGSVFQGLIATPLAYLGEVIESHPVLSLMTKLLRMYVVYVGLGKMVKAVELAPEAVKTFYGGKFADLEPVLEKLGTFSEALHNAHSVYEVLELLGGYMGFGESTGAYPVMAAVVRGDFTTIPQGAAEAVNRIPAKTLLAVSVATTAFPNIKLTISRAAQVNPRFDTFEGTLPWSHSLTAAPAKNLDFANPHFDDNPPYLVNNSAGSQYLSGEGAVKRLIEAASHSQTGVSFEPVANSVHENADLVGPLFAEEQDLAEAPSCNDDVIPQPTSESTMCYRFADGRA